MAFKGTAGDRAKPIPGTVTEPKDETNKKLCPMVVSEPKPVGNVGIPGTVTTPKA